MLTNNENRKNHIRVRRGAPLRGMEMHTHVSRLSLCDFHICLVTTFVLDVASNLGVASLRPSGQVIDEGKSLSTQGESSEIAGTIAH
jgi:hypothetical protein